MDISSFGAWFGSNVDFSSVVALLSLVVSLFVLAAQRRGAGRAHFTAEWENTTSVVFVNEGPGLARDVRVTVGLEKADRPSVAEEAPPPIPVVGAYQTIRVPVSTGWGVRRGALHVAWRDNRFRRRDLPIYLSPRPAPLLRISERNLDAAVRKVAREEAESIVAGAQGLASERSRARRPK